MPIDDDASNDAARRRIDRIVTIYLVVGVAWVGSGTVLVAALAPDLAAATLRVAAAWGAALLVVTAIVLRSLLRRHAMRLAAAEEAELRAADRLREVAQIRATFLRGISHELRTPLTNIVGYSQTLHDHLDRLEGDLAAECTDRLVANARRLERLVLDLLDLDRLQRSTGALTREPVRVDWLVRDIVGEANANRHKIHVAADPAVAHLDVDKTGRILTELIKNAVRHTPEGTNVWITAEVRARTVRICVDDDGPGIDARMSSDAFEPFSQGVVAADSPSPGLGIGLALLHRHVELQGGNVVLEPSRLGGARFEVVLPRRGPLPDPRSSPIGSSVSSTGSAT